MGQIFTADTNSTIARKSLVTYVNVATAQNPSWYALGYHCDDSSISIEMDTTTNSDILGNTFTDVGIPQLSQDLDPLPITTGTQDARNAFMQRIHNLRMAGDYTRFSNAFDCLIVYLYAGNNAVNPVQYDAQRYPESTISLGDFGGSADAPLSQGITVNFGGMMQVGYVTIVDNVVTFTAVAQNALKSKKAEEKGR